MFNKIKNIKIKSLVKAALLIAGIFGIVYAGMAMAAVPYKSLSDIATNVDDSAKSIAWLLSDVCLVAGIGFVMACFFKFHQHKLNPTQVPISQGITLLVIGAGLTLFPFLIPTGATAIMGKDAKMAQIKGQDIQNLIGG